MNVRDVAELKRTLDKLSGEEQKKAMMRGINKTMDGVKTDGVKMMSQYYALTAAKIRESWKANKCSVTNLSGSVFSRGSYLNLKEYSAQQTPSGVTVKILKNSGRKTVMHAFIGKIKSNQKADQVYRRVWYDEKHTSRQTGLNAGMMNMHGYIWSKRLKRYIPAKWMETFAMTGEHSKYRWKVRSLYGPRVQDYIADDNHFEILKRMTDERLGKNMDHEVKYLLSLCK